MLSKTKIAAEKARIKAQIEKQQNESERYNLILRLCAITSFIIFIIAITVAAFLFGGIVPALGFLGTISFAMTIVFLSMRGDFDG